MKKNTFHTIIFFLVFGVLLLSALLFLSLPRWATGEYQITSKGKTYQTDTFKALKEQGCIEFYDKNGLRKIKCNFSLK